MSTRKNVGKVATVTVAGVRDLGLQMMQSALRGDAYAAKAIEVWPALATDFAKSDEPNWKLFDLGAVDCYDINNPAPYAVRVEGELGLYKLVDTGTDENIRLTAAFLRGMTAAEWRDHKENAPTLYALCRSRKDDTVDPAIRSARRNLKNKVTAYLKKDDPATRARNATFVEAILKLVKVGKQKCTNAAAKAAEGEVDSETLVAVRVALDALSKSVA